jgi:hypothetical protein
MAADPGKHRDSTDKRTQMVALSNRPNSSRFGIKYVRTYTGCDSRTGFSSESNGQKLTAGDGVRTALFMILMVARSSKQRSGSGQSGRGLGKPDNNDGD